MTLPHHPDAGPHSDDAAGSNETTGSDAAALTGITPIEGVIFDFHSTLVDGGDPGLWLQDAWSHAGRPGRLDDPGALGALSVADVVAYLDRIWENTRDIDPDSRRDTDPSEHRRVWDASMARLALADPGLVDSLYATMLNRWNPYEDTLPTLRALRRRGVRVVVLSNVGRDLAPSLERTGMAALVDGVVLSYQVHHVKPEPGIFATALELLAVPAERALMVGDAWQDDGGAAALGIRTLLLPRTRGPRHGLGMVLRMLGG